jgi:3,4-dihydroxy 2-butanone 4-phosphate synthase/GTP cyclohydrolase II
MVSDTNARHSTNFTVSIEAARGVTTGISAADRATTIRAAVAPDAKPADLIQPGHIFPLMTQPGGVLARAGHTEAGSDLARLAGFEPASVIVEILNEDGSMARRRDLEAFARVHGLKIGTIADLIHYRMEREKMVEKVAECRMPTAYGEFALKAYRDPASEHLHIALVYGEIDAGEPIMVRVHMQDALHDMLDATPPDSSCPLRAAMRAVVDAGSGIVVILRRPDDPLALVRQIEDYHRSEQGSHVVRPRRGSDLRTYGVGAQILVDLGVRRMRVLGTPLKLHGLSGFGLEIVEYIACR